jgi:hypothetical protein
LRRASRKPTGFVELLIPGRVLQNVSSYSSLKEIAESRDLAKLGDALLGLLNVVGIEAGYLRDESRVTNEMLRRVSTRTGLRVEFRKRMGKRDLGNAVEALVAYWFVRGDLSWTSVLEELKNGAELEEALVRQIQLVKGDAAS